jgi:hypothetical protein
MQWHGIAALHYTSIIFDGALFSFFYAPTATTSIYFDHLIPEICNLQNISQ